MEKCELISVFKIMNILAGIGITILGLSLTVFGNSPIVRYIAGGMAIGVWQGYRFKSFYSNT